MRLFVGLDIPQEIRREIEAYVDDLRRIAPDAKWVRPESYHVTLKFIGEWKRDPREVIGALEPIKVPAFDIAFRGCGFFPNARGPRVFWTGIHADDHLVQLAHLVDERTATLGIQRDEHEYKPHLTLARTGSGSPRPKSQERMAPGMKRLA